MESPPLKKRHNEQAAQTAQKQRSEKCRQCALEQKGPSGDFSRKNVLAGTVSHPFPAWIARALWEPVLTLCMPQCLTDPSHSTCPPQRASIQSNSCPGKRWRQSHTPAQRESRALWQTHRCGRTTDSSPDYWPCPPTCLWQSHTAQVLDLA